MRNSISFPLVTPPPKNGQLRCLSFTRCSAKSHRMTPLHLVRPRLEQYEQVADARLDTGGESSLEDIYQTWLRLPGRSAAEPLNPMELFSAPVRLFTEVRLRYGQAKMRAIAKNIFCFFKGQNWTKMGRMGRGSKSLLFT